MCKEIKEKIIKCKKLAVEHPGKLLIVSASVGFVLGAGIVLLLKR